MLPKGVWFQKKTLSGGRVVRYGYFGRGPGSISLGLEGSAAFHENLANAMRKEPSGSDVRALILKYQLSPEFLNLRDRTRADYLKQLAKIEEHFGPLSLKAMDSTAITQHICDWRDDMKNAPRQADYAIQVLSILLGWGRAKHLLTHNRAQGLKKLYHGDRSEMTWSAADIDRFMAAAPETLQRALILAVETGQRQADILNLRWDQVHDDIIVLRQQKGQVMASVPISPTLRAMLDTCPKANSPTILNHAHGERWASSGNSFRTAWREASEMAGIESLSFHDLRGTFVTRCFEQGWTREEIAFCSGHSLRSLATLEKYANRNSIAQVNAKRLAKRMWDEAEAQSCKPVCKPDNVVELKSLKRLEAWPGIEPGCTDLQSAA